MPPFCGLHWPALCMLVLQHLCDSCSDHDIPSWCADTAVAAVTMELSCNVSVSNSVCACVVVPCRWCTCKLPCEHHQHW